MGIHKAMAAILEEFPGVAKDNQNPKFGYSYRGIDDALAALHPLLAKHGVFLNVVSMAPTFTSAGTTGRGAEQVRCVLSGEVEFTHADGSSIRSAMVGEGIDTADKALMKSQANALKYLIWYTFCVPTAEKKDSEAFEDPEPVEAPKAPKRTKRAASSPGLVDRIKTATREELGTVAEPGPLRQEARRAVEALDAMDPERQAIAKAVQGREKELG